MRKEHSFGIIPLRKHQGEWQVLMVCHRQGHWSFPKGHPEASETPHQTAERELMEEVGLKVEAFLPFGALVEHYSFMWQGERIEKQVSYFLATVQSPAKLFLAESEIAQAGWFHLEEAYHRMTFAEGRRLCVEAKELLQHLRQE